MPNYYLIEALSSNLASGNERAWIRCIKGSRLFKILLKRIVTGDETWVYAYDIETMTQ